MDRGPCGRSNDFELDDDRIVAYAIITSPIESNATCVPFIRWLETIHPEALEVIYREPCCSPQVDFTSESAGLYRQLAQEHLTSPEG